MQDVIAAIKKWQASGQQVALATVTSTWGSAPRQPGAKLALTALAHIAGSVSGGCVESEVVAQGQEALATGIPRLLQFGIADETAWSVGLACGGKLEVFVAPLEPQLTANSRAVAGDGAGRRGCLRSSTGLTSLLASSSSGTMTGR
jgi:xanthine dehydrogenase accessory factor